MSKASSWRSAHYGKRRHRTWLGAWTHALRVRWRFADRMYPYRCEWGEHYTLKGRPHYHAGHAPGNIPGTILAPRVRRSVRQPSRQMIIGFAPDEMVQLRASAEQAGVPYQRYVHDLIVEVLGKAEKYP